MINFSLEPLKKTFQHRGRMYRQVKKFNSEDDANEYVLRLEKLSGMSKRFPPVVQEVKVTRRWGRIFHVCIPADVNIDGLGG